MINLQDFINSLHQAIISANDTLANSNLALLEKYFELIPQNTDSNTSVDELQKNLHDTIAKASEAADSKEALKNVTEAFKKYQDKVKQPDTPLPLEYRSRNVILQYPDRAEHGFQMRNISVPLIALVPISMSEISEVKFKTNLEILHDGDNIKVGFPSAGNTMVGEVPNLLDTKVATNASLEITLTPNRGTTGLQKLIEGYEQVLRSQLPH